MEMTNAEKLIAHIKTRLAHESYTVLDWELTMLDKMLKALPSYEEEKVYHVKWTWSSSLSGQNFDSDGIGLEVPRDAVSNWICI